ncbi:MAG: S8 family peptidase, partial [Bacteroidia bacterium]|nr:S8 family peptidase [Bacteroidia bacterium]
VNPSFVNNNKPEILAMIESSNAGSQRIRLGVTGKGQFHAWNSGQPYRWTSGGFLNKVRGNDYSASYLNGSSANCVGENGGTGKSTISVGSYVARNSWTDYTNVYRAQNWLNVGEISDFSSRGPTTDNRIKPDISAPGQNIISSVNTRAFAGWMGDATTLKTQFNSQEFNWTMFSGTSMAAPHVAGIVALLLEANPTLTPQQIRDVLQQTAIRDKFTGADSNNNYGFGKVNAMGAIKAAIKLGNQNGVVGSFSVFPNPANGNLQLVIPEFANRVAKIQLYGFTGALVFETEVQVTDMGTVTIALNDVNPGIYNLMVQSGASVLSKKLAVMH